jgi:hypothetical protein
LHYKSNGAIGKVTGSSFSVDDPLFLAAVMVDQMAHRYGMLPSEILARGTTQDVFMYDIYVTYENYLNEKRAKKERAKNKKAGLANRNEPAKATPEMMESYARFKENI